MDRIESVKEEVQKVRERVEENKMDTMGTLESAIKLGRVEGDFLASSQMTHSILPMNSPKDQKYDDLLSLINKANIISKSQEKSDQAEM